MICPCGGIGRRSGLKIRGLLRPWEFKSPRGHHLGLSIMRWVDIEDIVIALEEKYPNEDVMNIRFTKLKEMVMTLQGFNDNPSYCNEKILEAIQSMWIEEHEA